MRSLRFLRRRRRVPFIPQMERTECGAACLAMVLAHHGHHAPLGEVREVCGVSRDGVSALAILRAAETFGCEAAGVRVELEALETLPLPAILHWGFSHFVVLERLEPRHATIVDPTSGVQILPLAELDRNFTGVALLLRPGDGFAPRAPAQSGLGRYGPLLRRHLPGLAQVLALSLLLQAVGLLIPLGVRFVVDQILLPERGSWLPAALAVLAAVAGGSAVLAWLRSRALQTLQAALDWTLTTGFVEHLLRLPTGFFLQRPTGDLADRVKANARLRDLLSSQSASALLDLILLAACLLLMLRLSAPLTLVLLLAAGLQAAGMQALRGWREKSLGTELAAASRESSVLVEALLGIESLRASGSEGRMLQRWTVFATQRINAALRRRRLEVAAEQWMVLLRGAGLAGLFLIGGRELAAGRLSVGDLAAFLTLESVFMAPIHSLFGTVGLFQYLRTHLARIEDVVAAAPEPSGTRDPGLLRGGIRLEDVSFRYSRGAAFEVRGVSVEIRPGERVALVGPSGAGKSTLARLLLGLLQPTGGTIRLDGQDLRELDLARVRRQIGAVLQDPVLLDETVRVNLTLADPAPPAGRLEEALRRAACEEVVAALPQGIETRLGDGGARLSGGQRQRLCLARALVARPAVLLLDEATSSLDRETEERVLRNLAALGCTQILIAHRLDGVRDVDRILVLEAGRIVQQGTWEELAGREGLFRDLLAPGRRLHAAAG